MRPSSHLQAGVLRAREKDATDMLIINLEQTQLFLDLHHKAHLSKAVNCVSQAMANYYK